MDESKNNLAYVIGVAIGDGNLSNPNGRAVRLRITCDLKYKQLIKRISLSIQTLLPNNKVSVVKRAKTYCDISCYSNKWEKLLGWKAKNGSKFKQNISIPNWIKRNRNYSISCLRGLLETDGSIYFDRGYKMVNFVTIIPRLTEDVVKILQKLGFTPNVCKITSVKNFRYTIRISKNSDLLIKTLNLIKN